VASVVIERLSKRFPGANGLTVRAVNDLSFSVPDQEMLVLVGPSGCGKTTTLRLLAGLEQPSAGTTSIDGSSMEGVLPKDRNVAMVFQSPALYPHLTVYENMAFGLRLRKCPKSELAQRVREAAETLGLMDCLERLPMALSGGQRQRVALGRALVRRPGVFLFDEPLSNLDPALRNQMRLEIVRLHRKFKTTSIYVTHDQAEAMTLGDRVAVMKDGKLEQLAPPLTLYQQPANLFVARFFGSPPMNVLHGRLLREGQRTFFEERSPDGAAPGKGLRLDVPALALARLPNGALGPLIVGLRPEHLGAEAEDQTDGQTVNGLVDLIEAIGAETFLHVNCSGKVFIARSPGAPRVVVGQRIQLRFDMSQAHFFDAATEQALR
jgi:multiple sugar transport system ATP-binding protein